MTLQTARLSCRVAVRLTPEQMNHLKDNGSLAGYIRLLIEADMNKGKCGGVNDAN